MIDDPFGHRPGARLAVVTGGAKGIGLGTVELLAARGWRCAILDADSGGAAVADRLGAVFALVDVVDAEQLRRTFARIADRHGPIHGLVNSAGINLTGPAETLAEADWRRVIDVDLGGTFFACQAAFPHLAPGAAIVNVASVLATRVRVGRVAYSAAKAGVVALTRGLALEWASRTIRVNAVAPAWTDTPLIRGQVDAGTLDLGDVLEHAPMGRLATVAEVAEAIAFLLSDGASFITGETLAVDGGYTWAG